jgi:predicted transcriptional regulator
LYLSCPHLKGAVFDLLEYTIEEFGPINDPVMVEENDDISKAINLMNSVNVGCCLVVDSARHLKGILTERDILQNLNQSDALGNQKIASYMTKSPQSIRANDSVVVALSMMTCGGFRNLPIVDTEQKVTGVISMVDVMNFFTNHLKENN